MEVEKKKKAIIQAYANLKIDGIKLNPNYLALYTKQNLQPKRTEPKLSLKRRDIRGINT